MKAGNSEWHIRGIRKRSQMSGQVDAAHAPPVDKYDEHMFMIQLSSYRNLIDSVNSTDDMKKAWAEVNPTTARVKALAAAVGKKAPAAASQPTSPELVKARVRTQVVVLQ